MTVRGYGEYALSAMGSIYDSPWVVVARFDTLFYFSKSKKELNLELHDFHGVR